ncbi:unnamed protein product [Penicillium salamii]|uniref:Cytochrome P450 n=1 Tax=Penicillium salamii TaxID=1612424 RepID=A0A9W4NRZ5_9EURO|nr:unnamed protein product [Penicillium salamii]CAG7977674.1 unnamed protein product [Penicillium salamii]CAG8051740.1 unnamed protein product [Penicillium salamii]CAG8106642.1 unnamed protein product [Penicillium salamii]CAG8275623.1 unnamed protein product [Penicillium salamii]
MIIQGLENSPWGIAWTVITIFIVSIATRSVYRLYFHPLSKFPGPKLTAITHLYEFYYDCIQSGQFLWEIARMHEQYGPIVRINPREIHIMDPHFFHQIYHTGVQNRDPYMVNISTAPQSTFSTAEYGPHKSRRGILNPFFSRQSVFKLEDIVHEKVAKVIQRLENARRDKSAVFVDEIFAALTADIISDYVYGKSLDILGDKELQNTLREALIGGASLCHLLRFFPILVKLLDPIPSVVQWLSPITKGLFDMKRDVELQSREAIERSIHSDNSGPARTIYEAMTDKSVPAAERTVERLRDDGLIMLAAGTETTARVLTMGAFYIYRDEGILQSLREELIGAMPTIDTKLTWTQLEKLPYLSAVVKESLRLSGSITIRQPRIFPTKALAYKDYTIPPGTPVSQSIHLVHMNPNVFPNPEVFDPTRWLQSPEDGIRLDRFLVSFSGGSMNCLGLNLAYCEIYHMFAKLVRHFDLRHLTEPEDIKITRDFIVGLPDADELKVQSYVSNAI